MHKFVDLKQGSDEWLEWRKGKRTASQACVIMNACPAYYEIKTWDDLRLHEAGLGNEPSEWTKKAWEHGGGKEAEARERFFRDFEPACFENGDYAASLDGHKEGFFLEVKCPVSGIRSTMLKDALEDKIQSHVWWQMVHQFMVLDGDVDAAYLLVYVSDSEGEHATVRVSGNELAEGVAELREQWEMYSAGYAQGNHGTAWDAAASGWLLAKSQSDEVAEAVKEKAAILKKAKDNLVKMAEGETVEGAGVKVQTINRKGTIDWKKVSEDIYEELQTVMKTSIAPSPVAPLEDWAEQFRPPQSQSTLVTRSKL